MELENQKEKYEFVNSVVGNAITPNFIVACDKGFRDAVTKGPMLGFPVWGARVALTDGATHVVDSSELAFRLACQYAFREAFNKASPTIAEPIMKVEVQVPHEFQGIAIASLNRRRGVVVDTEKSYEFVKIDAEVPLGEMFGYTTELRSLTQGKGEYSMEYLTHRMAPREVLDKIIRDVKETREKNAKVEAGDASIAKEVAKGKKK